MSGSNGKGRYTTPDGLPTWEYLAAFVCSMQAFCVGNILGWISPIIVILLAPDSPILVDHDGVSTIAAAAAVGHLIAPFIAKPMIDLLGRKKAMFLGGLPMVVCWILKYFAVNAWMLIIARFLGGLSFGACVCVGPLYLAEIASIKLRGMIGSAVSVMMNLGLLFAFVITPQLSISMAAAVFLSFAVTVQIIMYFIPESPYYLMMVGKTMEAEEVLEKLRGKLDVSEELELIKNSLNEDSAHKKGIIDSLRILFTVRQNLRAFIITTLFNIPIYFGGFVTIVVYGHVIFAAAGSSINQNIASITVASTKLVASIVSSFLVDRLGRKPLICIAGIIAGLCNFTVGGYFLMKEYLGMDVSSYNIVPLLAAVALVFAFNIGLVSLHSVLIGELYATDIKAIGSCITGVIAGFCALIALKMYLIVSVSWHIGHSVPFIGYGFAVLATTALLLRITPETKGKTFAEIQQLLLK